MQELAREKGVTPAQLALAWVLSRGDDVVPIPGTKRRTYLEENAGASEVELTDDDLARIDEAFPKGATRRRPLRGHVDDRRLASRDQALFRCLARRSS